MQMVTLFSSAQNGFDIGLNILTLLVAFAYYRCMNASPLEKAVSLIGTYRLAMAVGVKHPTIHSWLRAGRVPAERVLAVEAATGVSRHELRPDIYPLSHDQAA
jgi:hypothetical protein